MWRSVNPFDTSCADVYPQSTCYRYQKRQYRNFDDVHRNQEHAEATCRQHNGTLAPIRSREHLRFLSAIASADGSWIGGRRVVGVDPIEYRFDDPEVPSVDQYFDGWAPRHPRDLRQMCITIDNRGVSGNLMSTLCEKPFDFICEFPLDVTDLCEGEVIDVTREDGTLKTFQMPHPEECPQLEKALLDAETVAEAEDLLSNNVVCDFGPPIFHEELYCCTDCHNDTLSPLTTATSSYSKPPPAATLAAAFLALWLLIAL